MRCSSDAKAVDAKSGDDGKLKVKVKVKSVKFLCSYGGKILPRSSDGRLRYVGGETRLVVVNTEIRFSELMKKLEDLCSSGLRMKYQLPWEDLDTLVSVTCDEDVQFMMEEYERFEFQSPSQSQHYKQHQQQPKLRAFLFPATPSSHEEPRSPTQAYIELVNGRCIAASQRQIQRTKMRNHNANSYINPPESLFSDASENPQASSSNHRFTPPVSPRFYVEKTQSKAENGGHFHPFQMRRVPSEGVMAANLSSGSPPKMYGYAQHQIQIQGHNRMQRVHSTPNLDQCTTSVGMGVRNSSQSTRYATPLRFINLGH